MSILKPRTAVIPIYQGDDAADLAELRMGVAIAERQLEQKRALLDSQQNRARRIGDPVAVTSDEIAAAEGEIKAKQIAYDAGVDAAAERAVEVRVQAIGSRRFRDLVAAHPMRTVTDEQGETQPHEDDNEFGVDVSTFTSALLTYVDEGEDEDDTIRTIVEPAAAVKTQKALARFLDDEVSDGDLEKIFRAAYWINRSPGTDPKALRYSRSTGETSE